LLISGNNSHKDKKIKESRGSNNKPLSAEINSLAGQCYYNNLSLQTVTEIIENNKNLLFLNCVNPSGKLLKFIDIVYSVFN
jgi:hypothetical protein